MEFLLLICLMLALWAGVFFGKMQLRHKVWNARIEWLTSRQDEPAARQILFNEEPVPPETPEPGHFVQYPRRIQSPAGKGFNLDPTNYGTME